MESRRFVVSGHVQGVGFRAFVRREAEALGLTGEVWNRSDGGVELVASSNDPSQLDTLERRLWEGPGCVREVAVEACGDVQRSSFQIGTTR